jgi:hypothetical protein
MQKATLPQWQLAVLHCQTSTKGVVSRELTFQAVLHFLLQT